MPQALKIFFTNLLSCARRHSSDIDKATVINSKAKKACIIENTCIDPENIETEIETQNEIKPINDCAESGSDLINMEEVGVEVKEVSIEIDRSTNLQNIHIEDLINYPSEAEATVVPETHTSITPHKLSVSSSVADEQRFYIKSTFPSPAFTLEKLKSRYWFPVNGFIISRAGKVWKHSVLGQYGDPNFLTTYAVQDRHNEDGTIDYIFHEHLLHQTSTISEPVLITSHYASHNYGHFMLDMVPLIQLGAKLKLKMASKPLLNWQKSIYTRVGVNPSDVIIVKDNAVYLEEVFVSSFHNALGTFAASPNHRSVFDKILKNIPAMNLCKSPKKIFLSRSSSENRKIRNRGSLEKMLKEEGFEIICPEKLSFDDQARLLSQAELIVSEFGAVMVNVVFCKTGTKVIEIIPENQKDPWSVRLCASLGLEHITLFHKVHESDREIVEIAGRTHKDINFEFDANLELIKSIIDQI